MDVSVVWPGHTGTKWKDSAAWQKWLRSFLWAPGCFLLEERDLSQCSGNTPNKRKLYRSLKFQLVAGAPLPVPGCWATVMYFISLRCPPLGIMSPKSQKHEGTQVWENRSTFGDKDKLLKFRTVPRCSTALSLWRFEHKMHIFCIQFPFPSSPFLKPSFSRHFCLLISTHLPKVLFNSRISGRILFPTQFQFGFPIFEKYAILKALIFSWWECWGGGPRKAIPYHVPSSQKVPVVFDIQLPPFPELSPFLHAPPHIWGQVFGTVKN